MAGPLVGLEEPASPVGADGGMQLLKEREHREAAMHAIAPPEALLRADESVGTHLDV